MLPDSEAMTISLHYLILTTLVRAVQGLMATSHHVAYREPREGRQSQDLSTNLQCHGHNTPIKGYQLHKDS